MIELINASKYYPTKFGRHYIFQNVSLQLPAHVNVGIIGANGSGKSTLMRLLAGVDYPSEGRVVRTGKISWPLGLVPSMLPAFTGRENSRFICRIYGLSGREIEEKLVRIAEVAAIGNYFDMPVRTYSSGMRSRLNFATSMAIEFDYYLFDELGAPGDRAFRQTSKTMMEERLAKSRFILTSHNPQDLLDLCDAAILMGDGKLRYFDDVRDALREYGEDIDGPKAKRRSRRRRRDGVSMDNAPAVEGNALQERPKRKPRPQRRIRGEPSSPPPDIAAADPPYLQALSRPTAGARMDPPRLPMPVESAAAPNKLPRRAIPLRRPLKKDGQPSQ